jgi:hypothetical protein
MVIAAELSSPSCPPSAADWAAVSIAAASETSVTASAIVAFATVAVVVTKEDDHPRDGQDVNNCLHDDEHDNVIVNDGLTLSRSPSVVRPVDRSDQR